MSLPCFQVPIKWEEVSVAPILKDGKTVIPDEAIASIRKNTVALKGMSICFQVVR
jgi:isocitrate dehydrogenase (NAD+)